jgi:hypothetical protein
VGFFTSVIMTDPLAAAIAFPRDSRDLMSASLTDLSKKSEEGQLEKDIDKEANCDVEAQNDKKEAGQQDVEEDYFHMPTWRFFLVVVATCLTVLCMALVNTQSLMSFAAGKPNYETGQQYCFDCHPENHRYFSCFG